MTKPTHDRLVKIFSYLINFVRFRESQTAVIDEHFNKSEKTRSRIDTLYAENQEMELRLDEMRRSLKANEGQVKEKIRRNDELKARLLELRRNQERVAETLERAKSEKGRRQEALEEKTERVVRSRQEAEKLRPYVLESPSTLQSSLTELSENLIREKAQIDAMEKRARALQTSSDTFTVVGNDVQACIKLLDDISSELQKEEDEESRASRNKEAISDRGNNVREVEQTEQLLQRQLARWNERIEALRKNAHEKAEIAQGRMEELRNVQRQLREERAEKQRDMEVRRIRIEQTEKKVFFVVICFRLLTPADGGPQGKHRERGPKRPRPVSQVGVAYKALHHRGREIPMRFMAMEALGLAGYPAVGCWSLGCTYTRQGPLFNRIAVIQSSTVAVVIRLSSLNSNHRSATRLTETPRPLQACSSPPILTDPFSIGTCSSHRLRLSLDCSLGSWHSQSIKSAPSRAATSTTLASVLDSPWAENSALATCKASRSKTASRSRLLCISFSILLPTSSTET